MEFETILCLQCPARCYLALPFCAAPVCLRRYLGENVSVLHRRDHCHWRERASSDFDGTQVLTQSDSRTRSESLGGSSPGRPVVDMWTQISARCDAAQDDLSRDVVTLPASSHVLRQDQTGIGVPTDSSTSANLRHLLSTARKAIFFKLVSRSELMRCFNVFVLEQH